MQRKRNSNVNREEQYEAVDPFKASVVFSVKNLFGRRNSQQEAAAAAAENDLSSLPTNIQKDSRRRRAPARYGLGSGTAVPQSAYSESFAPTRQGSVPTMMHAPFIPHYYDTPPTVKPALSPVQSSPAASHSAKSPTGKPLPGLNRYHAGPFSPPPPLDHTVIRLRHSKSRSRSRSLAGSSRRRHRHSRSASRGRPPVSRSPTRGHHRTMASYRRQGSPYHSQNVERRRSRSRRRIVSRSPDRRCRSPESYHDHGQRLDQTSDDAAGPPSVRLEYDSQAGRHSPPRGHRGRSPTSLRHSRGDNERYSPSPRHTRHSSLPLPPVVVSPVTRPQQKPPRISTEYGSSTPSQPQVFVQIPSVPHLQLPPTTAEGSAISHSQSSGRGGSKSPDRPNYSPLLSQPVVLPAVDPTTTPLNIPSGDTSYPIPGVPVDISQRSRSLSSSVGLEITVPVLPNILPAAPGPSNIQKAKRRSQSPSLRYSPLPSRPVLPPVMPITRTRYSDSPVRIDGSSSSRNAEPFKRRKRGSRRKSGNQDSWITPEHPLWSSPVWGYPAPPLRNSPFRSHPIRIPTPVAMVSRSWSSSYSSTRGRRYSRSRRSGSRSRTRSPHIIHNPLIPQSQTPVIIYQPTPSMPERTASGPPTTILAPDSPPSATAILASRRSSGAGSRSSATNSPKVLSNIISGSPVPSSTDSFYHKSSILVFDSDPEDTLKESNESFLSQTWPYVLAFIIDTIPRQIYLHLMLRLPYLYFTRVTRIFEEAEMSIPEIKQGILETAKKQKDLLPQMATVWAFEPPVVSEPYQNLNKTWTSFIDSLLKEWKTLNIISVLLLTAILTILQLDGAGTDPLTRFTAMISMICALMSLLFGCMYIIRFGTMRKTYKAAEWASEAKRTRTGIFWNVWVMLAMPAAWLAWSMVSYIVCVMSFVWRTGTLSDSKREPFSDEVALVPRIVITVVLSLGLIYFCLIGLTLRRYGALMDRAWQRRIQDWIFELEYPTLQNSENPPTPSIHISANRTPTTSSYSNEKIGTYQSNEPTYPTFQPVPFQGNLTPAVLRFADSKKDLKSAMGTGAKNCGIHWDSKAKMENSVISLLSELDINVSPRAMAATTNREPQPSTLFVDTRSPYAPVRPSTPGPEAGHGGGAGSPLDTPPLIPGDPAGLLDSVMITRDPGGPFTSSPILKSRNSRLRLRAVLLSRIGNPASVTTAPKPQPRIRVTRLVGLSEGDPFAAIPPNENVLAKCGLNVETWKEFYQDAQRNWKLSTSSYAMNMDHPIQTFITKWNDTYFKPVLEQIQLCEECGGGSPSGRRFAIYHFDSDDELPYDDTRYDTSGLDIQRVDVLGPFGTIRSNNTELRRMSLFSTHLHIDDEVVDHETERNPQSKPERRCRVADTEQSDDSDEEAASD